MFALVHLILGTGTSKNKRMVLGNTLPAKKMGESEDMIDVCDDLGIKSFHLFYYIFYGLSDCTFGCLKTYIIHNLFE